MEALCRAGVAPGDITLIGKAYSTRAEAAEVLRAQGVRLPGSVEMDDPAVSYETEIGAVVAAEVARMARNRWAGRLLVLDEGAIAGRALLGHPDLWRRTHVVEQTTRGARWAAAVPRPFPVVDVARSEVKQHLEGPLIAESMAAGVRRVLHELGQGAGTLSLGVVGYGTVGRRLAALLAADGHRVVIHDSDAVATAAARGDGLSTDDLPKLLHRAQVLIGCTGVPLLDRTALIRLPRPLVLINGASSDIEFPVWTERVPSRRLPSDHDSPRAPWRHHYTLAGPVPHMLAAGGFPVNFYCQDEPIPAPRFQVTRALMLAGAFQAVSQRTPGLHRLADSAQIMIETAFRELT
ncbi:NAD(P)-dependent oxidoreductase [Catellatospora chokoriensis]|nr:NAD(P)-dependent oxidoreductase [Catellatospora chokoriensis]